MVWLPARLTNVLHYPGYVLVDTGSRTQRQWDWRGAICLPDGSNAFVNARSQMFKALWHLNWPLPIGIVFLKVQTSEAVIEQEITKVLKRNRSLFYLRPDLFHSAKVPLRVAPAC